MGKGSVCPNCGFLSDQLLLVCPRCLQALRHEHCNRCGRCPGASAGEPDRHKKS